MSGAEKHASLLNQWADALEELPSGPFASEDIRAAAAALTTAEARMQELEAALTGPTLVVAGDAAAAARIAELEAALREADCPRPANHRSDEETVASCVNADLCGCCLGAPLMSAEQRDRARRTLRGE